MATTLKTKNSVTTTVVPTTLAQGELAVNITDKKMWVGNAATTPVQILGAGATNRAGGSNTQVQYNSSGDLAGSANMTFDGTKLTLANDASISGLTVGKGGGAQASNTALGNNALTNNSTGTEVVAVGQNAIGNGVNTGSQNTAIGVAVMYPNTSGASNFGGGYAALRLNTTGSNNVALGHSALYSNTTASNNTAVGYQANYNSTGAANTSIGYLAGKDVTTGGYNFFAGFQTGGGGVNSITADNNVGIGNQAYTRGTSGTMNIAIGAISLGANTSGSYNTAIGGYALQANTTASNNTAVGYQAGYNNTTGITNTFVGSKAGYATTTNSYNTFIGEYAGYNTTSAQNTFVGEGCAYLVTSGAKNTVIGRFDGNQSGLDIRTASNYIVLSDGDGNPRCYFDSNGRMLSVGSTASSYNHYLANNSATAPSGIAYEFGGASPNNTTSYFFRGLDTTTNRIYIYSNGTVSNATGTYNTISDAKLKENITDATSKLDKLMDVKVRNYNLIGDDLKQIGFVAQELETVFPSLVYEAPDLDREGNDLGTVTKGVKLTVMIPILVKAIQELKAELDATKAEVQALKAK